MDAAPITRRRALALGAAAGAATLLARVPDPALAATSSFSMTARLGRTLRAPRRFDLVGLQAAGLERAHAEIRTRAPGGRWSRWIPIHSGEGHGPDAQSGARASDPIWVDGARELELRARGPLPGSARLRFVAVSPLARRAGTIAAGRWRRRLRQASGAPAIMPRAAWGARAPRGTPAYGEVQLAFVHHTVTANEYRPEDVPAILRSMQAYHMDSNGWNDIGYNFLVDMYGTIWEGRAGGIDQPVIGAQAQGYNDDSTGVSNIGTFTSAPITPAALEANARLIAWKLSLHAAPVTGVVQVVSGGGSANRYPAGRVVTFNRIAGHRDGGKTSCPGDALYGQLGAIRARAAELAPGFASATARLTMGGSASAIAYGERLTISGALRRVDGSPVAGAFVTIEKRGKSAWVPLAKAQAGSDGTYSLTMPWRATGRIRARADVDGAIVVSPAASVYAIPRLSSVTRRVRAGSDARVRGKVRPAERFSVLIERRTPGGYRRVGTMSVRTTRSAFKANLPLRRPGRYKVTPVVKSGTRTFRGKSALLRAIR